MDYSKPNGSAILHVAQLLKQRDWHISFAESCTGGKAAARLVDVPSASAVFEVSYVTYSNDAKIKLLGVKAETIAEFGAVSEQVAAQMCEGVAKTSGCEVGVGITGIAGPAGESSEKPVGTVCFGFYINGKCLTFTQHFGNIGRNNVRDTSVNFVFAKLSKLLE